MKIRSFVAFVLLLCLNENIHAQKVIQLYNGAAPGSEKWNWQRAAGKGRHRVDCIRCIATYDNGLCPAKPNGTAVVIALAAYFNACIRS